MLTDRQKQFAEACKGYNRLTVTPTPISDGVLQVFCKEKLNGFLYDKDICSALILGVLDEAFPGQTATLWKLEAIEFLEDFGCWVFHVHIQ